MEIVLVQTFKVYQLSCCQFSWVQMVWVPIVLVGIVRLRIVQMAIAQVRIVRLDRGTLVVRKVSTKCTCGSIFSCGSN